MLRQYFLGSFQIVFFRGGGGGGGFCQWQSIFRVVRKYPTLLSVGMLSAPTGFQIDPQSVTKLSLSFEMEQVEIRFLLITFLVAKQFLPF